MKKRKPKFVAVFGRHRMETDMISENIHHFKRAGFEVHKIPKRERVLAEPGHHDRDQYHDYLAHKYKHRKVVDLHTAPGFRGFYGKKFKRNVVGLEIPAHDMNVFQERSLPNIAKSVFKKKVIGIDF